MSDRKNKLESYVSEKFKKVYKYARPTIASGATPAEKGDVKTTWFTIECKIRNTDSFSIKHNDWQKLKVQASNDCLKEPLYIVQNESGERLAIMNLDDWFNMFYELIELRSKDEQ